MASILKKEYSERKRYLLELLLEPCDAEKSLRNSLDDQQMSLFLDTLDHRDRLYTVTKGNFFKSSLWNPLKHLVQAGRGGFPHTPPVFHTGLSITLSHGPRMRGGRRLA